MKTAITKKSKLHGGKRNGAGRHTMYGEKTTTIAFRVPISKEFEIKELIAKTLRKYAI